MHGCYILRKNGFAVIEHRHCEHTREVVCYVCGLQTYSHQYNHYMFVVLVICFLYLVLTLLTFTIRVIPHYYLPVSINNIVSNFLAEGLPALCPTG